jgi:hypothetical protein
MKRQPMIVGAVAIGALLAGGGIAYATIPDSGGAIHACYARSGGALRVVDAAKCKTNENSLAWNQAGVPGAEGTDGVSGREVVKSSQNIDSVFGGEGAFFSNATCPTGKVAVGGGADGKINGSTAVFDIRASNPFDSNGSSGWTATMGKAGGASFAVGESISYTVYAICVTAN